MANSLPSELIHLILEFTSEMNRMETGIRDESLEDTGKQTDWFAEFENRYALILNKYCTAKKRTYKRQGYSLAHPYYYGIDAGNEIAVELPDDEKAQVEFAFTSRTTGENRYRFTLFKKKAGWKIDSVQRWSGWKKKWVSHIL